MDSLHFETFDDSSTLVTILMNKDELLPDDVGAVPTNTNEVKRDALSAVDRMLQVSDMKVPGVQKLVLDRLDKAELQVKALEKLREDYYSTREKLVVAESTLKRLTSMEILQDGALAAGALMFGFVPSAWGNPWLTILVMVGGSILVIAYKKSKDANRPEAVPQAVVAAKVPPASAASTATQMDTAETT